MALSANALAAAGRLTATYNANTYNATTNPGGLASGGHRVNFVPALQDLVTYGGAIAAEIGTIRDDALSGTTVLRDAAAAARDAAYTARDTATAAKDAGAASATAAAQSAADALTYRNQAAGFTPTGFQAQIDAKLAIASKASTAQAQAGTDDVLYMTATKTHAAVQSLAGTGANKILKLDALGKIPAVDGSQITGINVLPAAGAVGSYIFAAVNSAAFSFGQTVDGSLLRSASVFVVVQGSGFSQVDATGGVQSGTWRALGTSAGINRAALFQRIA